MKELSIIDISKKYNNLFVEPSSWCIEMDKKICELF